MAFSFRAGTNWCHDFPKLARESGFYFNMHRTHVRVDWNRISTIDIDRVIRERDFFTIDDNINNVVDYHLETEYDVKILDPNFVKLFRLAQLSVEYLLYCKQYLDHSVIILKDELRSKLEENVKLKKELSVSESNMKELKDKFRDKYKLIEKRFSDSHGEIHKCPFCPKTFIAEVFMNSHINRRHSNVSQLSVASPVHEQYKAEAEKLHDEIKTLKERLNETERVIRCESMKLYDSTESSKVKYNDIKNDELERSNDTKDKRLEEEHKIYREEMNNLTAMLFNEIRSLKQDEKQPANQNVSDNENMKELLKEQENEINRLRDQIRQLSIKKSVSDMETIQAKLNAQENYWQIKIDQLESQHRNDIETLYTQLKLTQATADFVKADYIKKIDEFEKSKCDQVKSLTNLEQSIEDIKRSPKRNRINSHEQRQREKINRKINIKNATNTDIDRNKSDEILIENIDKISDADMVNTSMPVNKCHRITVNTNDCVDNFPVIYAKGDIGRKTITLKPPHDDIQKSLKNQQNMITDKRPGNKIKFIPNKNDSERNLNSINRRESVINVTNANKMDVSSSESDKSYSQSEDNSESKISESDKVNRLNVINYDAKEETDDETTEISEDNKQSQIIKRIKSHNELKMEIQETLEQKLRDLGIDPEWQRIPNATYRQLIDTVRYHRSINSKKYSHFEIIRRKIVKQLAGKVLIHQKDNIISTVNDKQKKSPLNKLITNVKSKTLKALNIQENRECHTPKLKSHVGSSHDKSITNKFNIELLPKKINHLELRDMKSPMIRQSQLQKSRTNDDNAFSSSINDRYTLSPSKLNAKSTESIDMKHLSHSYESIKDYMKDNSYQGVNSPINISGPITTSTPQRDCSDIISRYKTITAEVSSQALKFDELTSQLNTPKNSKSVLKSTVGSTGSLVKKKVLFDLDTIGSSNDNRIEPKDIQMDKIEKMNGRENESESDYEISNISEEMPSQLPINEPANSDNIVLRTSQSDKIAEISRKLESQLNSIRHKPLGGIEAMFNAGFQVESNRRMKEKSGIESMDAFKNNVSEMSKSVAKLPQPTPRTPRLNYSISSDKSDIKDSNLDKDIEELLRED